MLRIGPLIECDRHEFGVICAVESMINDCVTNYVEPTAKRRTRTAQSRALVSMSYVVTNMPLAEKTKFRCKEAYSSGVDSVKDPVKPQVHICVGEYIEQQIPQTAMMKVLKASLSAVDIEALDLLKPKSIRRMHCALTVLAMAYQGAALLNAGLTKDAWTLITDGGTMRAGFKVQAVRLAKAVDASASDDHITGFMEKALGSIPVRDGTEEHTTSRIFDLFSDLLYCAQQLPHWVSDQDMLDSPELKDMLGSIEC